MAAIASKRFSDELSLILGKRIGVRLVDGAWFEGKVSAYNPSDYSLWLEDVRDMRERAYRRSS